MNAEESIERTTGYVLWVYALLFAFVAISTAPSGRSWIGIVWLIGFTVIYYPMMSAASKRANPLNRLSDRRMAQVEYVASFGRYGQW